MTEFESIVIGRDSIPSLVVTVVLILLLIVLAVRIFRIQTAEKKSGKAE